MALEKFCHRKKRLLLLSVFNFAFLCLIAAIEYLGNLNFWPTALLVFLPQQIFAIPTFGLLVFCAWKKRRGYFLANLAALFFVGFYFLGFNIPLRTRPAVSGKTMRVLTYNIRYGSLGNQEIIKVIKNENPDIFCLQEVIPKGSWPDPFPALKKQFPEYSVARYGQLVTFARWPIHQQKTHRLAARSDFGILETQIKINGKNLTIFNVHLSNPVNSEIAQWPRQIQIRTKIRERQFALLRRLVQQQQSSYLIAGDFNTPPRVRYHSELNGLGTDVFKASGWGFGYSFPAFFPMMRIDYLWASKDFQPRSSRVLASRASDHRALTAQLALE